jgi:hypothetical protein
VLERGRTDLPEQKTKRKANEQTPVPVVHEIADATPERTLEEKKTPGRPVTVVRVWVEERRGIERVFAARAFERCVRTR